ncbi:MAG: hypothetical protein M5U26_13800 [Planctomycetota bacterium]|nr:hypothetical protein [Planctomycetota bacterium]
MTSEWKIAKSSSGCRQCQHEFKPGEIYFSALAKADDQSLRRDDYCPACFQAQRPAEVFSFWKTSIPLEDEAAERRPVLDIESVLDFFRRLAGDSDVQKVAFRYVLALMLTRKRVLKLGGSGRDEEGRDVLVFVERKGGEKHDVRQPDLAEGELSAVSEELGRLLGLAPPKPAAPSGDEEAAEAVEAAAEVGAPSA